MPNEVMLIFVVMAVVGFGLITVARNFRNKTEGVNYAKQAVKSVRQSYRKEPDLLEKATQSNTLSYGNRDEALSRRVTAWSIGILRLDENEMVLMSSRLNRTKFEPVLIPVQYESVDVEKSRFFEGKSVLELFLKGSSQKFVVIENENSAAGTLRNFATKLQIKTV